MKTPTPPQSFLRFFRWFCHPDLLAPIEGDLLELYEERLKISGKTNADWKFILEVLLLCRPSIVRPVEGVNQLNQLGMFKSYFKIGWRNLLKNKGYSIINIGGLASGMAVALLIGLWIYDELTFNQYHQNYPKIVQIMKGGSFDGKHYTGQRHLPFPLIAELETNYQSNFKHLLPFQKGDFILSIGDRNISRTGAFIGEGAPDALTLKMTEGTRAGLHDPHSIMLSQSTAKALFGDLNPLNKEVRLNTSDLKVTGVYEDLPYNSEFSDVTFFCPWDLQVANNPWMKNESWSNHFLHIYAELADNHTIEQVGENIRDAESKVIKRMPGMEEDLKYNPVILVHPMSDWHLYSNFKQGQLENVPMQNVKIIGIIGSIVLLLACINFMNLSTARSEKRAKEVGIRKSVGSARLQLISQFFSESFLVVLISFVISLLLMNLALPWFNDLAAKKMQMPWMSSWFWLGSLGFIFITGALAGSYPALYLSSFNAMKVLKGTFRAGRFASLPRQGLVVVQFTVSVCLIIGTMIVYDQIIFAKNRPVGYAREGLIMVARKSDEFYSKTDALTNELKETGAVLSLAESGGKVTEVWSGNGGFTWEGKNIVDDKGFATLSVSHEFGKTVGWQFVDGRDFSRQFASDSGAFVLNEAAIKYMNLKNPVGKIVHWTNSAYGVDRDYRIIGVIKDMVMESPFEPVEPSIFFVQGWHGWFDIKINPEVNVSEALQRIEAVFKKIIPSAPFDYQFADLEYASKFAAEERVGKLALVFSILAIFISCLGLFGLASFVAEQRTKEIGIRKVVGATVFNLWKMLSKDFVFLSALSCLVASPIAYYFLSKWLEHFQYRTTISGWTFITVGILTITITILTVSYQSIKAALANPVESLRSE